jgi:diguanylate cyclase (GGDEF)-like protein
VRDLDLVARLGGDEFAIACHGLDDPTALDAVATRVTAAMQSPIAVGRDRVTVGASVGIAYAAPGACTVDELIEAADAALYKVKETGRGAWRRGGEPVVTDAG